MGRVVTADIKGRIGFGVASILGFLQDIGKSPSVLLHLGEDVVAGPVQYPVDAGDLVGEQAFANGLDRRNTAGDRGFKTERNAVCIGEPGQFDPVICEQRLVGCHHMFASLQCGFDRSFGDPVFTADQFNKDIDVLGLCHCDGIIEPLVWRDIDIAIFAPVTRRYSANFNRAARAGGKSLTMPGNEL